MSVGHRLHLRLLLEGVEVPVVAADVQSFPGSAAVSSIQIPANDFAMDLLPRTLAHLFIYDYLDSDLSGRVTVKQRDLVVKDSPGQGEGELSIATPERFENNEDDDFTDTENRKYRLLFGGELMGISVQKTPTSRGVVLQCADFSSYWDIAFQYMVSGYSLGRGGIKARFGNYNTTLFREFFRGSADIITQIMSTAPRSHKKLEGTLLGGLMNLIEAIGGTYFGTRAVRGSNDFFSIAELRLHLTQMVGANPFPSGDEKRLLRARGFNSLFRRSLSGLGKQVSIRNVLQALEKYIFHQVVPITSPRYIPAQIDPSAPSHELIPIKWDKRSQPIVNFARMLQVKSNDIIERIETASGEFVSEAPKEGFSESGGLQLELTQMIKQARNAENKARMLGRQDSTGGVEPVYFGLAEASQAFASASERLSQVLKLSTTNGVVRLPRTGTGKASRAVRLLTEIRGGLMQKVLNAQRQGRVRRGFRQPDPPPRLLQQIYRPDVWMVAPPRCNVLFPELYTQFTYGRNFNAEVTRLLLRTHDAWYGSDVLFDGFYFAPSQLSGQRTGKRNRKKVPDVSDRPAHIVKDMMKHELYTGVIPTFERMSDLNLHALRRNGSVEIDGMRVGFAQLAANHIFFQYRFRSRQLSVSAKFNPYITLGFPALVIDKYRADSALLDGSLSSSAEQAILSGQFDGEALGLDETTQAQLEASSVRADELLAELRSGRADTHYLGTPKSITHSINAVSGGETTIQMGYARTTNERTEFLGDTARVSKTARKSRTIKSRYRVGSLVTPQKGMVGPRGGKITAVKDITDEFRSSSNRGKAANTGRARTSKRRNAVTGKTTLLGTELPLFIGSRRFIGRTRDSSLRVLVGVEQPVAHYGTAVVALVGTGGDVQTTGREASSLLMIRAYEISEDIDAYRLTTIDLPPEELVFPPWYGEKYRTTQVGSLYNYFFGTGSIVDPLDVGTEGLAGSPTGGSSDQPTEASFSEVREVDDVTPEGAGDPVQANSDEMVGPQELSFGNIDAGATIGEAVTDLVNIYSKIRHQGSDVNEFIRGYTWRPIATAVDILGTANLQINDQGDVVRGVEGFHSRAFGDYDDLRLLVSRDGASGRNTVLGLHLDGTEKEAAISARLDTRKEKRAKVLKYLHALLASRGILG